MTPDHEDRVQQQLEDEAQSMMWFMRHYTIDGEHTVWDEFEMARSKLMEAHPWRLNRPTP